MIKCRRNYGVKIHPNGSQQRLGSRQLAEAENSDSGHTVMKQKSRGGNIMS